MCERTHKEVGFCATCGKTVEVRYFVEKTSPKGQIRYVARCPVCNAEVSVKWVERKNEEESALNAKIRHTVQRSQQNACTLTEFKAKQNGPSRR